MLLFPRQDDIEKHVGFCPELGGEKSGASVVDSDVSGQGGNQGQPMRLHRRDTPHHLKNKRINPSTKSADLEKVASIIAQVGDLYASQSLLLFFCFMVMVEYDVNTII